MKRNARGYKNLERSLKLIQLKNNTLYKVQYQFAYLVDKVPYFKAGSLDNWEKVEIINCTKDTYGIKAVYEVLNIDTDMQHYYSNKQNIKPWHFEEDVLETIQAISESSIINDNIGPVYGAGKLADEYNELTKKQNGNIMTEYIARKVMDKLGV